MALKKLDHPELGEITLFKRRGNRSIRLTVSPVGGIRVSLPMWLPYRAAEQFVQSKSDWIRQRLDTSAPSKLEHGQRIGKAHRLVFEPRQALLRVSLRQNEVLVVHPERLTAEHPDIQNAAKRGCIRALRHEAEKLLPGRLQALAERTGLGYNSVSIKHFKSRWGSCSSSGDIALNLFLMQLPWRLIDYVLLHELTHTKVMRHGPPFWSELDKHAPGAKRFRTEIAEYHPAL